MDNDSPSDAPLVQDRAEYFRQVAQELVGLGVELARMVHQDAKAQAAAGVPGAAAEATVAFDRVSRAVRRTILLAQRLDEAARAGAVVDRSGPDWAQVRLSARKQILRRVEDKIVRDAPAEACDALQAELVERLDAPEMEDDVLSRPVSEIIDEICTDLGLKNIRGVRPWKRRTPEDVAALCARAAAPSRDGVDRGELGRGGLERRMPGSAERGGSGVRRIGRNGVARAPDG